MEPIGNLVQVLGGGTPSTKEPAYWQDGTHPFCTPRDMSSFSSSVLLETERHLTDLGLAKVSSGALPKGTLLLSSRAPIGYLAIAEAPVTGAKRPRAACTPSTSVAPPERSRATTRKSVNVLSPGMTDTPIITREGGPPGVTPEQLVVDHPDEGMPDSQIQLIN